ncbi:unnamed protein product [Protopolystoma xenopodis]|uniref:Uncharacterized protein n=1 Tax=Protopolystoma xenopodis TaxID=117903 RepID=A0A448WVY8_9PLAT|nr:unnamed protein product [Protopolystoma xenopodis]
MAGNSLMSEIGVIKKPPKQIGLTYSLNLIKTQSTKSGTSPVRRPPTMEAFAGAYKIQQDSSASSPVRRSDYSARDQMKSDFSNRLEESSAAMENLQFRTSLSSSKLSALRYPLVSQRIGLQLSNRRHFLPTTIGEGGRDWILGRQVLNEVSKMGQRQVERRTEGEDIGKEYEGEAGEEEEEGELEEEDEQGREQENDQGEEEEDEEEEEEEEEEKEEDEEEEEEEEDEEEEEQEEEEEEEEDEEEKDEEEEEEEEEEEKEEEEEEEEEEEDENEEEEEEEGEGEVTAEDEEEELDAKKDEDEDEDASEERLTSDQLKSKKQASLQVNVYSAQPEQHYLYPHIYQPASRPSGKQGSHRNSEQIDSYSLSCPFRVQANRSSRRLGNQDIHGQSTDTSQTTSLFSGPSSLSSTTGQGGWNDGRQRVTRVRSSRIGERSQAKESKGVSSYGMSDKKREEIVKNDRLEYFIDAKRGERRRITRGPSNKRSHIRRTNNVNSRNLSSEHHIYQNLNLFSSVESSLPYSRTQGICEQATRSPPPLPARTGKVIEMDTKIRNTKKALSSYLYKVPIFGAETQSYSTTKPSELKLIFLTFFYSPLIKKYIF